MKVNLELDQEQIALHAMSWRPFAYIHMPELDVHSKSSAEESRAGHKAKELCKGKDALLTEVKFY